MKKQRNRWLRHFAVGMTFIMLCALIYPSVFDKKQTYASIPDYIVRVYLVSYGNPKSLSFSETGTHKLNTSTTNINGAFTVKIASGKLKLIDGDLEKTYTTSFKIKAGDYSIKNYIKIEGGYSFTGDMEFRIKNGGLQMINHVDMESYLKGVLPFEMSNSSPYEALKAQAVASRSEAYYMVDRYRNSSTFDVYNSTQSQVYFGYQRSATRCIKAVNATAKKIIVRASNSDPCFTPYGASNGGKIESAKNSRVSDRNYDYMPAKNDKYDLKYTLNSSAYSAQLNIPKNLSISSLNSSNAKAYKMIRTKLLPLVKKDKKKITSMKSAKLKKITLTHNDFTNPKAQFNGAKLTIRVDYKTGKDKTYVLSYLPYKSGKYRFPFINNVLNLKNKKMFILLNYKEYTNYFKIYSGRFGHGSGMSQIGAYQMANSSKTYKDIIAFYYSVGNKTKLITKSWNIDGEDITKEEEAKDPNEFVRTSNYGKTATVNVASDTYLNMRSGASTSHSVIKKLYRGNKVTLKEENASWVKITYQGLTGYVYKSYLKY